jgi:NAD-dependent SIR2 family protein deacetylase
MVIVVEEATMRAREPLPNCPKCGSLARPNVLMFGDGDWEESRALPQENRFRAWLRDIRHCRLAVIECGAGLAVPTVRHACETVARQLQATLLRINVREPSIPDGQISLAVGALQAFRTMDTYLT